VYADIACQVLNESSIRGSRSESGFRPYLAGGAGVKVYTGSDFRFVGLPPPMPPAPMSAAIS
jgi:hypothetical protein